MLLTYCCKNEKEKKSDRVAAFNDLSCRIIFIFLLHVYGYMSVSKYKCEQDLDIGQE